MTAELGLSDAQLDQLFELAHVAEAEGRLDDALGALTVALAQLTSASEKYQYVFEWMAQLESAAVCGPAAEHNALVARAMAGAAGREDEVFRMEVLRARIARENLDLDRAAEILSGLHGRGSRLGPPVAARCEAILGWMRSLAFPRADRRDLAVIRTELVLVVAELWSELGHYESAIRLLDEVSPDLAAASGAVRTDQVELLRAELLTAAGRLAEAHAVLDRIPPRSTAIDRARVALVRVRAALSGGQLARADRELASLAAAPIGEPMLFASAACARIAVEAELNRLDIALRIARAAAARLTATGSAPDAALELIQRARLDATARGRSSLTPEQLPYVVAAGPPAIPPPAAGEPAGSRWRLAAAWTAAANAVMFALERGDLAAAGRAQAELERLTHAIESDHVAARVALSAAMIAYYAGTADVDALLAIAGRLRALGARLAEAQALRYAGWAAARRRRYDDHAVLARRVSAIIDEIHDELEPSRRASFMRNKWNGRDELANHLLRTLLGRSAPPTRREVCDTFRGIDLLTHQRVDDALGDPDAATLHPDATDHETHAWLQTRLDDGRAARARARRSRTSGLAIRSTWSLWRIPARTLILHYHVLPDRTFLFRIARRHIDVCILPYGRMHFGLDMRAAADDPEQLRCLAVSTGIVDAVSAFPGIDRLVIVPHDAIASVPFAALPVGERRLCEIGPIVQLDRIARLRRRSWRRRTEPLLSVGRQRYRGSGLQDLEAAELEAISVAEMAGTREPPLLDATRQGLLDALPGAARVHVAAHGLFDVDEPARSGIVLGDDTGGYATLTLRELRALDLRALQLATLATCRSAAHAQLPGRERISLPTALLDAGARGVIASLWPIDDAPSVEVMRALYTELRAHRPAAALARVQAALLRRPVEERPPARHWAGLVFYGNE